MSCIFDQANFIRIHLMQTESTNLSLREAIDDSTSPQMIGEPGAGAPELPEYFTITAAFQTGGRGQRGNSWESEPKKNLLMSTLLQPDFLPVAEQFRISQVVSLAVAEALGKLAPESRFTVKWPNDIYCGGKKICGILIEHDLCPSGIRHSIIGIGINVNQEEFRSDAPNPVSLLQILGREVQTDLVLSHVMACLKRHYEQLRADYGSGTYTGNLDAEYARHLYRNDQAPHPFADGRGTFRAVIDHVEPDGQLFLRRDDGTLGGYYFKEVEYLPEHPANS